MSKNNSRSGLGILDVILIVQIILKLFGLINWSWGLVLWPLWVSIVIIIIAIIILCMD
jgi:hypothetical protein